MGSDLKEALEKALGLSGSAPTVTVEVLFSRFCTELDGRIIVDPIGREVRFSAEHFPYLIKLEYYNPFVKNWVPAKARIVIAQLCKGQFDASKYRFDEERAKVLFRVPDLIKNPDSIHRNVHPRVKGTDVYSLRPHGGTGPLKVVLVTPSSVDGRLVPVTSFWTTEAWFRTCAGLPALYVKT